ncbi:MAG: hypothetical protein WCW53_05150 [Syntrophales bacterium]|jgi:hypothetical protein
MYIIITVLVVISMLFLWVAKKGHARRRKKSALKAVVSTPPDPWAHFSIAERDFCKNSEWVIRQIDFLRQKKQVQVPAKPFIFEPTDTVYNLLASGRTVDLQNFVEQICNHIHLKPVPTVAYDWDLKLEGNTAGQVRLDSVKPEISVHLSYTSRPRELGTLLAHEVTHHYLDAVHVRLPDQEQNEKLTDLAAMFLGLGKLMLNGADVRYDAAREVPMESPIKLGYLPMAELACAFDKICCLNGIQTSEWTRFLSSEAAYYVQSRTAARKSSMSLFLDAKLRYENEVEQLRVSLQRIKADCRASVETLAVKQDSFHKRLSRINENCHSLRVKKRDGIIFVRMNNEQTRFRESCQTAQRLLNEINALCSLVAAYPNDVARVHTLSTSGGHLLQFADAESSQLQNYLKTMGRYDKGS